MWHTNTVREREAELLFIGQQFRQAIRSYYESSPEAARTFPPTLDDLIEDRRLPVVRRHLRRIWRDPVTGKAEWGLVRMPDGRITGVHSLSTERPRKIAEFPAGMETFATATRYRDWVFDFRPGADAAAVPATPATGPGAPAPATVTTPSPGVPVTTPLDPRAPSPPRDNDQTREQCDAQRREELDICEALFARRDPADRDRCRASAEARAAICASGSGAVPPPLYDGTAKR